MAPKTDFSIPVNSEIDLFVKHSKGLEISLEDPQHLPLHPPPETRIPERRTTSLEPIFKKPTPKAVYSQQLVSLAFFFQIMHVILCYHTVYNAVMTSRPAGLDRAKDSSGTVCLDPSLRLRSSKCISTLQCVSFPSQLNIIFSCNCHYIF